MEVEKGMYKSAAQGRLQMWAAAWRQAGTQIVREQQEETVAPLRKPRTRKPEMRPTEWDRERIAAFLAERRQATVERRAEHAATARCIGCGGALGVVRKVTKKFCSKACRVRHYDPRRGPRKRDLDRAARRAEWAKRPCDLCGRPLGPVRSTWKRFCSRDCYEKASAPKRGVLIEPRARRRA